MFCYALLEPECYYLLQLNENDPVILAQVKVISDHCMFVVRYENTVVMEWVKKSDPVFDIIELLSDDIAQKWLSIYNNEDAYYEDDED